MNRTGIVALSAIPVLCVLGAPALQSSRFEFQQPQMGTTARVVLYANDEASARTLANLAFRRIAEIDARLSDYRQDSELMRLCARAGGPARRVSGDLFRVLAAAGRMAQRTGGAFDVTVGPVSRLWRRARATGEPPPAPALAQAKALVDYRNVELSATRRTVRLKRRGMILDLGGIGKGYAADQALALLRRHGAASAFVALGGDVVVGDPPPGGAGWTIAVAPLGPDVREGADSRVLRNAAISTSGDAEQYLLVEGVRHSHVLDPSSGSPRTGRRGVTVVAPDGMTADALSTAVNVLGAARGLPVVEDFEGAAALVVEGSGHGVTRYASRRW